MRAAWSGPATSARRTPTKVCGCPITGIWTIPRVLPRSPSSPRIRLSANTGRSMSRTTKRLACLSSFCFLKDIGDATEDWGVRETWLLKTISELWRHRGLYPGLLKALKLVGAAPLIDRVKQLYVQEGHEKAHAAAFAVLEPGQENVLTKDIDAADRKKIARNWKLL